MKTSFYTHPGDPSREPHRASIERHSLLAVGSGSGETGPRATLPSSLYSHLLATLPADERRFLIENSQRVELAPRMPVAAAGAPLDYCYFIERGMASCMQRLADGFEGASAMIGPEGLIGLHAVAEAGIAAPHETVVQVPVVAQRVPAAQLGDAIARSPEFLAQILRFNEALRLQLSQSTVCNLHHSLPHRLARWLLMAFNRIGDGELPLTQEALSSIVGASRASVTHAAGILRDAGAISYRYRRITLRDRQQLEDISCECYAIVRNHYRHLLEWWRR